LLTVRVYSSRRSKNCLGRSDGLPENIGIEEVGGTMIVFEVGSVSWVLLIAESGRLFVWRDGELVFEKDVVFDG
jgi:hypothetical protein